MMKYLLSLSLIIILGSAFVIKDTETQKVSADKINWMTWEEAMTANEKAPKKIFIDVYTDWCGWCKKMDKSTFVDASIVEELNANFYAIKFNAEQKEVINFNGSEFKFVAGGRRGYHQLAYALLDGRMGYPAFVLLNESYERIMLSPGYKQVDQLIKELTFASSEAYKLKSWDEYSRAE